MNEAQTLAIKEHISDAFDEKRKVHDFAINSGFSLLLAQLDLFKVLGGLIVALSSIGYLSEQGKDLDQVSLWVSFLFGIAVLLFSVSYTRETIDNQAQQNEEIVEMVVKQSQSIIDTWVAAIKAGDDIIYYNFVESELDRIQSETKKQTKKSYMWEIVVFSFYSAVWFLLMSVFFNSNFFCERVIWSLIILLSSFFFACANWAYPFSEFLSSVFSKRK